MQYVVWELTLACDLACGHCGSRAGRPRPRELSTDECLALVNELVAIGAREIALIGGEAYLRSDWTQIVRAIRAADIVCTLTTGGRGMTAERARAAADAGISSVSVSIDGVGATHDRQRGVIGAYAAALAAIANLVEAGVVVTVNSQINRISAPELERVYEVIRARGARAWQVQLTVPAGRAADRPGWILQPWQLLEVMPRLAALSRRGLVDGIAVHPGNNVGYFGADDVTLRGRGVDGSGYFEGCTAGDQSIGIEADGTIKGCPALETAAYAGGNIRETPLRALLETRPLRYTRDRTVDALWGFCRDCMYAETCRGGCTWTAHSLLGRPGNNPLCQHRAEEHQRKGLRERLVQVAPAPGTPFD
ncbi:MAG: radical SAM protein, partial [Deltaproteobacteria bacterium]|nr:radical SAM protein [Deltaproteobacteria bacterium]